MIPADKKIFLMAFIILVSCLSGCATLGPVYQKVDKIPDNSGLVYIYRPSAFIGGGLSPNLYTDLGKTFLTKIYSGGYFPYVAKPGKVFFSAATETESSIALKVEPGQTYYIKLTIGVGFFIGRPELTVVDPDIGEHEIKECQLIPQEG